MLHSHIHEYGHVRNGWNGHRMLIMIEHMNLEIRKNKTSPGGTHKITVCPARHKNIRLFVALPLWRDNRDHFPVDTDNETSEAFPRARLFGLDNLNKNPAWFLQRPKYRFSNIETFPKGPNYRYSKFSGNRIDERNLQGPESKF